MAYSLDQKGQIEAKSGADLGGNYSTHSNAGFHNSIFPMVGTDAAKIAGTFDAAATATGGGLPVWVWIAAGVIVGVYVFFHRKKGA